MVWDGNGVCSRVCLAPEAPPTGLWEMLEKWQHIHLSIWDSRAGLHWDQLNKCRLINRFMRVCIDFFSSVMCCCWQLTLRTTSWVKSASRYAFMRDIWPPASDSFSKYVAIYACVLRIYLHPKSWRTTLNKVRVQRLCWFSVFESPKCLPSTLFQCRKP